MSKRRAHSQSADARVAVSLACTVCQTRNYKTTIRPGKPLEIKKFCKICGSHTVHVAAK